MLVRNAAERDVTQKECGVVERAKLFGRESKDRRFSQRFSRSKDDGREVRVMDGVGIMLRLKADGGVAEMIPRVELNGGLRGSHFHNAAALRLDEAGGDLQPLSFGEDVVVIVAGHFRFQLLDAIPDARRLVEIHERAFERKDFARGK